MKKIVLFLLLLSAFITKAQTILLSENFNYPIGSKLTDNGWTAHSGAGTNAQKVADEVLYNSSYSYSGVGFANALATSGEDVNRKFTTSVSSGKVYVSFLLNVSAAQDGGGYFFHLGPSTIDTVFRARVSIRKDADGYNIGISKSTANANYATERYVFGKTYNIVVKYTFNNATNTDDEVALFIEQIPSNLAECNNPEPAAKVKAIANELDTKVDIGSIAIRQGSSTTAPTLRMSNITVATDWNSAIRCSGGSTTAVISDLGVFTNLNSSNDDKYRKLSTPSGIPSAFTESMFTFGDKADSLTIIMPEGFETTIDYDQKLLKPINFQKSLKLKNTIKLTWYFRLTGEKAGKYEGYVTFSSKNNETVRLKIGGEVIGPKQQTIADIRKLSLNSTTTVSGRVVAADQFGSTLFVQDGSAGIAIFSAAMATAVQIGDSVSVTGTLSKFNELLQLSTPNLTFAKIDVPKKIVSPKSINLNETSGYEGQLVSIKDVVFTEKGFVFVPNSNYQIAWELSYGRVTQGAEWCAYCAHVRRQLQDFQFSDSGCGPPLLVHC